MRINFHKILLRICDQILPLGLIVIIFAVFFACVFTISKGCSDVVNIISEQGLKNVVERIWEGEK